jgi:hypothetical protein
MYDRICGIRSCVDGEEQESRQERQEIGLRSEFNQATAKKPAGERRWGTDIQGHCQEVDDKWRKRNDKDGNTGCEWRWMLLFLLLKMQICKGREGEKEMKVMECAINYKNSWRMIAGARQSLPYLPYELSLLFTPHKPTSHSSQSYPVSVKGYSPKMINYIRMRWSMGWW